MFKEIYMKRFKISLEAQKPFNANEDNLKDITTALTKSLEDLAHVVGLQGKLMTASESASATVAEVCILSLEHINRTNAVSTLKISTEGFKDKIQAIYEWIKNIARKIWQGIKNFFSTVRDIIGHIFFGTGKIKYELLQANKKLRDAEHEIELYKKSLNSAWDNHETDRNRYKESVKIRDKIIDDAQGNLRELQDQNSILKSKVDEQEKQAKELIQLQNLKSSYRKLLEKLRAVPRDIFVKNLNGETYRPKDSLEALNSFLSKVIYLYTKTYASKDLKSALHSLDKTTEGLEYLFKIEYHSLNTSKEQQIVEEVEGLEKQIEKITQKFSMGINSAEFEKLTGETIFARSGDYSPVLFTIDKNIRLTVNPDGPASSKYTEFLDILDSIGSEVDSSATLSKLKSDMKEKFYYLNSFFSSNDTEAFIKWTEDHYEHLMKQHNDNLLVFIKELEIEENIKFLETRMKFFEEVQKYIKNNDENHSTAVKQALDKLVDALKLNIKFLSNMGRATSEINETVSDVVKLVNNCIRAQTTILNVCAATIYSEGKIEA